MSLHSEAEALAEIILELSKKSPKNKKQLNLFNDIDINKYINYSNDSHVNQSIN